MNTKIPAFIILLALITLPLHIIHSQDTDDDPAGQIIVSIEISGLKRTKIFIARMPLEKFIGRDASTLEDLEVETAVVATGTLEPKSVELIKGADGIILHVTVAEKWTILPYPVFMYTSTGYNFGLYLLDYNFLGIRDSAAIGGTYGKNGWSILTTYSHTPNERGKPGWTAYFAFNKRSRADLDKYQIAHRYYSINQLRASFGMSYPIANYLSGSSTVSFSNTSFNSISNAFNAPDRGAMLIGISQVISTGKSSWDGYFLSQKSFSFDYSFYIGLKSQSYHQAGYRAVFEHSLTPGLRALIRSGAVIKSAADLKSPLNPLYEDNPARSQADILPAGFAAKNYAGFSAGLEVYVVKFKWGLVSITGSWQLVFSYGSISGFEFDNGPYAGLNVYLNRVAIPAMGFGLTYNLNSGVLQYGLNLSMSI